MVRGKRGLLKDRQQTEYKKVEEKGLMANEGGAWIMHGMDWDAPYRIHTYRELINWINEIGFLPLFINEVEGR